MLLPEDLENLPERIVDIYIKLEEFTIKDIARRLKQSGTITSAALHQIKALKAIGFEDIDEQIKKANKIADKELELMYVDAVKRSNLFNKKIINKAGLLDIGISNELMNTIESLRRQTKNELFNFTRSLGFTEKIGNKTVFKPIAKFYQDTLDFAQLQVQSGVLDYGTAIKNAVDTMSKSGIRSVDYASGCTRSVEAAVRTAVMTGLSQTSAKMTEEELIRMGTDLVEVSAHSGARPSHKVWQGKVYSFSGASKKYPSLVDVTGYGTIEGLCGINCKHSISLFFEGISKRNYTDEELANIDKPDFEYEGKTYTEYEARQKQRQLERAMRKTKLKMIGYKEAGLDSDYTAAAVRLRTLREYYADFSDKAGLKTQYERAKIGEGSSGSITNVAENSPKPITQITEETISSVPLIKISGYNEAQAKLIQNEHKELLRFSMTENNSEEVAFILSRDFRRQKVITGNDSDIKLPEDVFEISQKGLIYMHNHPRNSSFSKNDIVQFILNDRIKTFTIVKNNGKVEALTKINTIGIMNQIKYIPKLFTGKNKPKAVSTILNLLVKKGVIEWEK